MKTLIRACAVAAVATMGASGCATIVAKSSQVVTVTSAPPSASVSITNRAGRVVHSGRTPLTVTLKKGAGYFKPETYKLRFTLDGYQAREVTIRGQVSGWYFGNILFGGLIGMIGVDPATGAMYKLQPDTVDAALEAMKSGAEARARNPLGCDDPGPSCVDLGTGNADSS